MSDLIKLYNPANASQLTSGELEGLQKLTSAQIKELAQAYPNVAMQRAYLLIKDGSKNFDKQLATLSSFENLWNLREKNGLRTYVAVGFKGNIQAKAINPVRRTEVRDLSDTELMSLPGFKTATKEHPAQQVQVTKIKKVPINPLEKSMEQINSLESLKSDFQKKVIVIPTPKKAKTKSK